MNISEGVLKLMSLDTQSVHRPSMPRDLALLEKGVWEFESQSQSFRDIKKVCVYQSFKTTLADVLIHKNNNELFLQIGPRWDMKIERAELVRELLRMINSLPQGFALTPSNLGFVIERD